MATSADDKAANIKAALEVYAGNKIDASPQQIEQVIGNTPFPFSSYSFTPADPTVQGENIGKVVSRTIVVRRPPSCDAREILDVSAFVRIPDTGHATLRINNFLCPADQPTKRNAGTSFRFTAQFVPDFCNAPAFLITGLSAMMQNLPFLKRR